MTYVLHKYYNKTGPPTETIAANNLKNAKIRAYRIAMRDKENLDRIGIETLAKSHNTYHAIKIFVRYADGKVWYTSGKTKKQLLSNGEFATDVAKKPKEDIFAWFTGGESVKKPKTVAKPKPAIPRQSKTVQVIKNKAGVKVGDVFYTSWGYDQTNVDFYQVIAITEGGCYIRPIGGGIDEKKSYRGADYVYPILNKWNSRDSFINDSPKGVFKKTVVSKYDGSPHIKLASFAYGRLYKGGSIYETAAGYGH